MNSLFQISSKNQFHNLSYVNATIQPSTVAAVHSNFFKLSSSTNRHQNSRHSSAFSSTSFRSFHSNTLKLYSTPSSTIPQEPTKKRSGWSHETPEQVQERSEWSKWFKTKRLEKNSCQISFARSSGAGGQHVNKVETKAIVKMDLAKVMASGGKGWNKCQSNSNSAGGELEGIGKENGWLLFSVGKRLIEKSQYYILSSNSLQLSSMKTRSKDRNLEDALSRLHEHLLTIASDSLPSKDRDDVEIEKQSLKVEKLKEKEDRKMKLVKERRGGVKSGRKGGKGDLGW